MRFNLAFTREDYDEMNRVAQGLRGRSNWLRPLNAASYVAAGVGFVLLVARPPVPDWVAPALLIALALVTLIYPTWYAYRELEMEWSRQACSVEGAEVEARRGGTRPDRPCIADAVRLVGIRTRDRNAQPVLVLLWR